MHTVSTQSIIARAITSPEFLSRLRENPETALAEYHLSASVLQDFASIASGDLARLAAFVTMVQHNYLWDLFPNTRRLLRILQIELDVFSACAADHQLLRKNSPAASRSDKIHAFISNATEFLKAGEYGAAFGVLCHETEKWELDERTSREQVDSGCVVARTLPQLHLDTVVQKTDGVCVVEYAVNPLEVIAQIYLGDTDYSKIGGTSIAYWIDPVKRCPRIGEIDALLALIIRIAEVPTRVTETMSAIATLLAIDDVSDSIKERIEMAIESGLLVIAAEALS